jgi:hypothetical protein
VADRTKNLRKVATATSQKSQRKEGEGKTSSFGSDVQAELAKKDMERWEKERIEGQEAQEDEEEFFAPIIPRGVPSTTVTSASATPNEKKQKVADSNMGASNFHQLFADTTGHSPDDLIDQGVPVAANQDEKVQKEEEKDEEPSRFVRGSIKARRL